MASENSTRNPKLSLSLGYSSDKPENNSMQFGCQRRSIEPYLKSPRDYSPSLALCLQSENEHPHEETLNQQESSPNQQENLMNNGLSSFCNKFSSVVKREREVSYEESEHAEEVPPSDGDHHHKMAARKKLRLTKQQSAILESSFTVHNTLNPKQKLELAEHLKLRPRQVEVWFQNRRARTKLKQTEVECELLKKCCETLTIENRKLYIELEELKADKVQLHPALYMQLLPPSTLCLCSSCEQTKVAYEKTSTARVSFAVPTRPPYS